MPSRLRGSSSPQAPPPLENGGYGEAVDGAVGEAGDGAVGEAVDGAVDGAVGEAGDVVVDGAVDGAVGEAGNGSGNGSGDGSDDGAVLMMAWMPTTVDTLIMDDTAATPAELRSPAIRSEFRVSAGKAPNRQRAVSIPRIPSLLPPTAAPLRYALMIDTITDPIMGESIAKNIFTGFPNSVVVRSVNTPAPTPKTTISLMLKDASGGAVLWACRGGGGTGASASGVGTCAVRWTGLPQDGQNRSPGLNSCPQLPQYLCGNSAILPCLFRLLSHLVGHPLAAHRLASMLLLYLISIGESEYHPNGLFLEFFVSRSS
jgi:hypothetical protein